MGVADKLRDTIRTLGLVEELPGDPVFSRTKQSDAQEYLLRLIAVLFPGDSGDAAFHLKSLQKIECRYCAWKSWSNDAQVYLHVDSTRRAA